MYLLSVIPLIKIPRPAPQTLDYFSVLKADIGAIVGIQVGHSKILGVVVAASDVKRHKQQIKKSRFALKPVEEIINPGSIIPKSYLKLAIWASTYYYASTGLVLRSFLPQIFSRPTKKFKNELAQKIPGHKNSQRPPRLQKPILYWDKTEERISFYRKEIEKAQKNKKSILFLVPEFYKIDYFKNEIPALKNALVVHSSLTAKTRYTIWDKSLYESQSIIGTRSALIIPLKNLGLIIVDEEESDFYKSFDQAPYINARDVAIKLSEITGSKIILGSSMPSIESFHRSRSHKYTLKKIQKDHVRNLDIIDMKEELKNGNYSIFSKKLQERLLDTIQNNKQAILFINRRGLSTGLLCRDCGHIIKCQNCDVPMVYHQNFKLICHHCGQKLMPPTVCPECKSYKIKFIGAGTQRVEAEFKKFLDAHKIADIGYARLDSDITPTFEEQQDVLKKFRNKKYSVLVGTQSMLKEGLLPKVNLVSIITIDPILSLPDFRINELIFKIVDKLWTKSMSPMILQTYIIDNYAFTNILNNSAEKFLSKELSDRKELLFPPFSQIIKLSYKHSNPEKAEQEAKILANKLKLQVSNIQQLTNSGQALGGSGFTILGPAPAFIPRVKNGYIWQFLIKSTVQDVESRNKLLSIVPSNWKIDVDPIETL